MPKSKVLKFQMIPYLSVYIWLRQHKYIQKVQQTNLNVLYMFKVSIEKLELPTNTLNCTYIAFSFWNRVVSPRSISCKEVLSILIYHLLTYYFLFHLINKNMTLEHSWNTFFKQFWITEGIIISHRILHYCWANLYVTSSLTIESNET